jgi:predicted MFS family arabinose efflux permease
MTQEWFSPDSSKWLAFLSLLALLAIPAEKGRFKAALMTVWIVMLVGAAVSGMAAVVAAVEGQPSHVVNTLSVTASAIGIAFGGSFFALRKYYREAELRKTIASDL